MRFLNLGCGNTTLPLGDGEDRPPQFRPLDDSVFDSEIEWINLDIRPANDQVTKMDLFWYPWGLESNAYDGALLSHICEHIPHEPKIRGWHSLWSGELGVGEEAERFHDLTNAVDGWFCFFAELWRVLKPDAVVHILSPHAFSLQGVADPSHTRYLVPMSFAHSMGIREVEKMYGGKPFEYHLPYDFAYHSPTLVSENRSDELANAGLGDFSKNLVGGITEFYIKLSVDKAGGDTAAP